MLYDDWYDAEFARLGLDVRAPPIFIARSRNSSRFVLYPGYKDISETWY